MKSRNPVHAIISRNVTLSGDQRHKEKVEEGREFQSRRMQLQPWNPLESSFPTKKRQLQRISKIPTAYCDSKLLFAILRHYKNPRNSFLSDKFAANRLFAREIVQGSTWMVGKNCKSRYSCKQIVIFLWKRARMKTERFISDFRIWYRGKKKKGKKYWLFKKRDYCTAFPFVVSHKYHVILFRIYVGIFYETLSNCEREI